MVYLDAAATTPVRREALEAMWPHLTGRFGNPSSVHALGHDAAAVLDDARRAVARVLGARPAEVTFTSGGTEGDNAAVKGLALARREATGATRVVVSAVEHDAVLASAHWLGRFGFEVVVLRVDGDGRVDPGEVAAILGGGDVAVVSLQLANNEVGTVQPVARVAALTRAAGVPLHTDAVQAAGWLPLDVAALGVDALTLSGHKVGAPPGTGALWVRRGVRLEPLMHGGGQERGRRSGTENVPGAVGFGVALGLAEAERVTATAGGDGVDPVSRDRDAFVAAVLSGVGPLLPGDRGIRLTGHPTLRLPGHASFVLGGVSGEAVLLELEERGVLSSSGSACHAGSDEPSHVLTEMGIDRETAQTALRFTWSRTTSAAELTSAAHALVHAVRNLLP